MNRKHLNGALVLTLLTSILAACSGGASEPEPAAETPAAEQPTAETPAAEEDTSSQYGDTGGIKLPIVDEPTTLTWMLVSENPANDKLIAKEIEKRTGITLDLQTYSSTTYQDRLRVVVASGQLPDIFHGLPFAELKKIGQQGAVVAINDYADMLPNFKKLYIDENPWVVKSYGDEAGKLYSWPIYNMNRDVNHGWMYRKDIFDKLGIPEWTNTDEFYEAMKKVKEAYPDSFPIASKTKDGIFRDWGYGWGVSGASYPMYYDEAAKTWKFAPAQAEFKDMLDFMKKLYNEGLLDPEFLTDTPDSWTAKLTTDKAFVTWDWIGRLDLFYNQVKDQYPTYDMRYANPVGPTGNVRTLPKIDVNFGITVANNDKKEIALKLLDYLTSPSGAALVTLGVEGETFNFDADGKPVYPELADVPLVDIKVLEDKYGLWLEGMYLNPDRRSVYYNFTEKEQEAQDKIVSQNKFEALDPVLNFSDDENATIAELQVTLMKEAAEFSAKYILDKAYGDAQWSEWQQNAEKAGASQLTEVFNAAQARFESQ
ncbi:extracellular solute-binding protein [Paenibacillus sp.]|uniref:extracellular solute-binding protein n=1 Tax=Paenibacillus sp. TaxID=58172 RepID=UPI0028114E6D|nr:extracellular solute-binding protein [Paenibacillus sp.]